MEIGEIENSHLKQKENFSFHRLKKYRIYEQT